MKKYRVIQMFLFYSCLSCMAIQVSAEGLVELRQAPVYNYEERKDESVETLSESLEIPHIYQNTVSDKTGRLTILTDAGVKVPEVSCADVVKVTPQQLNQNFIDRVTDIFFPDAVIYDRKAEWKATKEELQELIDELEGYIAEDNYDPYDLGKDSNGEYRYDIKEDLERCKAEYSIAPESRELTEIRPSLFTQWEVINTEDGYEKRLSPRFEGIVHMPDGTIYDYSMSSYSSMPFDISIRKRNGEERSVSRWDEDNETIPPADFTIEEARQMAEDKIAAMGLEGMQLARGTYAKWVTDIEGEADWEVSDHGYLLHYTRNIDGMPITYAGNLGAWPEEKPDSNSDLYGWNYEKLEFAVTKEGIQYMRLTDPYDVGETLFHNVKLLSFDEIMDIYNAEMISAYEPYLEKFEQIDFNIDTITFGYARIYQPNVTEEEGVLVPVWDFFGERTTFPEEERIPYTSDYVPPAKSLLTINAIDGSIIDRGLGY